MVIIGYLIKLIEISLFEFPPLEFAFPELPPTILHHQASSYPISAYQLHPNVESLF